MNLNYAININGGIKSAPSKSKLQKNSKKYALQDNSSLSILGTKHQNAIEIQELHMIPAWSKSFNSTMPQNENFNVNSNSIKHNKSLVSVQYPMINKHRFEHKVPLNNPNSEKECTNKERLMTISSSTVNVRNTRPSTVTALIKERNNNRIEKDKIWQQLQYQKKVAEMSKTLYHFSLKFNQIIMNEHDQRSSILIEESRQLMCVLCKFTAESNKRDSIKPVTYYKVKDSELLRHLFRAEEVIKQLYRDIKGKLLKDVNISYEFVANRVKIVKNRKTANIDP